MPRRKAILRLVLFMVRSVHQTERLPSNLTPGPKIRVHFTAAEVPRQRATLYTYTILYPMTREGQPARRQPCRRIGSLWTTQRVAEVTKSFVGKGSRRDSKRRSRQRFAETVDGKHRAL